MKTGEMLLFSTCGNVLDLLSRTQRCAQKWCHTPWGGPGVCYITQEVCVFEIWHIISSNLMPHIVSDFYTVL